MNLFDRCKNGDIEGVKLIIDAVDGHYDRKYSCGFFGFSFEYEYAVNITNVNWNYGLFGACFGGHLELAKLMISRGANDWNWGLYYACRPGHEKLAELAISYGADYEKIKLSKIPRFQLVKFTIKREYEKVLKRYHRRILEEVLSEIDSHPPDGNWHTVNSVNRIMKTLIGQKYSKIIEDM